MLIVQRHAKLADGRDLIYFDDADTELGGERRIDERLLEHRPANAALRQDVLTGDWISVAAVRQNRVLLPPVDRRDPPVGPQHGERRHPRSRRVAGRAAEPVVAGHDPVGHRHLAGDRRRGIEVEACPGQVGQVPRAGHRCGAGEVALVHPGHPAGEVGGGRTRGIAPAHGARRDMVVAEHQLGDVRLRGVERIAVVEDDGEQQVPGRGPARA